jgi:hypothetical protein
MGQVVSAAFLGNQFEYVVQLGTARVRTLAPKYDPQPVGARVTLRVRGGAYTFWCNDDNGGGRDAHAV